MKSSTLTAFLAIIFGSVGARAAESSYSMLDFDRDCIFEKPASEEEAELGASAICRLPGVPVIYFQEGDLRQSVGFGAPKVFQSFGEFNRINTTIEWRGPAGQPYAAIVRYFIEHTDQTNSRPGKDGQVLVVHKVATGAGDASCIVGMVDALANRNANVMAREIADQQARAFDCSTDRARYHGKRGDLAGEPAF